MRRVEILLLGLVLAFAVIGVSVRILTAPFVTQGLFAATGQGSESGLDPDTAADLAQLVRGYVTGAEPGPLPASVDGRDGFSASAVSHLDDVRQVMARAAWATVALVVIAAVWIALRWRLGRRDVVAGALKAGALWLLVGIPVLAVFAWIDFDTFFAGFHALFFQAGTWQFSADELLIQLFPEAFWVGAGASWAALILAGAGGLWVAARVARSRLADDRSS